MNLISALKKVTSDITRDDVGKFWVVTKPSEQSCLIDILFESTINGMANQYRGGLKEDEVLMFTHSKERAERMAKMQVAYEFDLDGSPSSVYVADSNGNNFDLQKFDPKTGNDLDEKQINFDIDEFLEKAEKI